MAATVSRLVALDSPVVPIPAAIVMVDARHQVDLPLPSFLIEHERARVLIDTGLDPDACDDPTGVYGEAMGGLLAGHFPRDKAVDAQLERLGLGPRDIDLVLMTHLHFDHTGAMRLFAEAPFLGGRGEMAHAYWPGLASLRAGLYRPQDFGFLRERPLSWTEIGPQDHDLFGDGSVVAFHLPGHTPGQLAVLVRTPQRTILLSSDVVHLREGLDGTPAPTEWSFEEAARSLGRLRRLEQAHQAELWITHDPGDWRRLAPEFAGDARGA